MALATIIVVDLWSIERLYWRFSPPAGVLYRSDPLIEYLKRAPQPGRVIPVALQPLTSGMRDPFLGGQGEGKGTGLMVHGVRSIVGYHVNELGRYEELIGWPPEVYSEAGGWPQRITNPNLRRLTNARYLYTNAAESPFPDARLVAGPATNAAGNIVYLYELAEDNPAAWVTPIAIAASDESVIATVLDPRFDVRRAALFDTATAVPVQPVPEALPPASNVAARVTQYDPGRISIALDRPAPAGSALIVSENYYPGWEATVDGRAAPVGRAQYVLIGVGLPAGARAVELRFRSKAFERGRSLTLAALAAALLLLMGGLAVSWRRRG